MRRVEVGLLASFLIIVAIIVAINFGGASGLCGFVEEGGPFGDSHVSRDETAANMGHPFVQASGRCGVDEWSDRIVRVIEGTVGVESFAGAFFEENFVAAEEMIGLFAFFDGDEEDLAVAFAPGVEEILRG